MKVAPLYHVLVQASEFQPRLVHTGQHYDSEMWQAFLRDFALPDPDFNLAALQPGHQLGREEQLSMIEKASEH